MNEPTEQDVEAAVEAMVDVQDQFRESTTFHDLARAALAAVEPEPTERDAEALQDAGNWDLVGDEWTPEQVEAWRNGRDSTITRIRAALRGDA